MSMNRRILVIDDNPSIHEDFRKILGAGERAGAELEDLESQLLGKPDESSSRVACEVDAAHSGQEGAAKLGEALENNRPYSLAFVDMRMPPGWDGVETAAQLWALDPRLQVVICTAYSDHSWESILSQLGRRESLAVLKKPFDNIEAMQLAEVLMEKWSLACR